MRVYPNNYKKHPIEELTSNQLFQCQLVDRDEYL
jgi:hypothetical protein